MGFLELVPLGNITNNVTVVFVHATIIIVLIVGTF